jgi:hypothetical protein
VRNVPLHAIAISESWLNKNHSKGSFEIPGCNYIRKDQEDGHRGGGVITYGRFHGRMIKIVISKQFFLLIFD